MNNDMSIGFELAADGIYQVVDELSRRSDGLLLLTSTPEQLGVECHIAQRCKGGISLLPGEAPDSPRKPREESKRRFSSAVFVSALSGQLDNVGRQVTNAVTKRNGGRSTPELALNLSGPGHSSAVSVSGVANPAPRDREVQE